MEEPSAILQGPAVVRVCWDARLCLSPHPPPSPARLVHYHLPHPHQACGEEGGRDSLVAAEEGDKRETGMRGREGKHQAPSLPTAPVSVLLMGAGCGGRRKRVGDSHLAVALHPLTWLPRPQPLTPLLGRANTWPGARHSCFTVSSTHIRGVSASSPSCSSVSQSLQADEADAC